jgi:hypothetical protein
MRQPRKGPSRLNIAIIGILVALLLPAIQAAREASRRSACQSNIKQFGLALHGFLGVHNVFPSNSHWYTGNYTDCGDTITVTALDRNGSMLVKLMPYMEEATLFDRLDFDGDIIAQFKDAELRSMYIPILRCPSDTFPALSDDPSVDDDGTPLAPHATTSYGPSIGAQRTFSLNNWCPEPRGNEFGNGDDLAPCTHVKNKTSGVFARINWAASIKQVPDGTSKTIAMGEVLPDCNYELIRSVGGIHNRGTSEPPPLSTTTPVRLQTRHIPRSRIAVLSLTGILQPASSPGTQAARTSLWPMVRCISFRRTSIIETTNDLAIGKIMKPSSQFNAGLRRYCLCLIVFLLALFVIGCADSGRPNIAQVRGKVTYKGVPVAKATVAFLCPGAPRPATGTTDASGLYILSTYAPNDGATIGTHVVTVNVYPTDSAQIDPTSASSMSQKEISASIDKAMRDTVTKLETIDQAKPAIPAKYSDRRSTDLRKEVVAGNNVINIELTD